MTWFFYLLLIIWILIGILALLKGSRFIMILLPPLAISSGIMVGICIGYLDIIKKYPLFQNKKIIQFISILVILIVTLPGIINIYDATFMNPFVNDDLQAASNWINNNTSNDTVIISEWSYGYFLSAYSNRPVSVDGGSQNSPRTFWIYKAFSTDDENLSAGIFRMIATSGDSGPIAVDNYTKNTTKTVELLNEIIPLSKDNAQKLLIFKYGLNDKETNDILNYTHPSNVRPFVIVTTSDMLNKGYWTFYFGLWDFNKNKGHDITYSLEKNILDNSNLNNQLKINLKSGEAIWNGKLPYMTILNENNNFKEHYNDRNSDFSIFSNKNESLIISKGLEKSLFIKLVLERSNETIFKPIYGNNNVVVWKV